MWIVKILFSICVTLLLHVIVRPGKNVYFPASRALARDPSTRHLDGLFHLWTGKKKKVKKKEEGFIKICMFF